jgi:predicted metal-dependent hydrolase
MEFCEQSPSGSLLRAMGEFNRGDWFECHETLEEMWIGTEGDARHFYQGVLQIAVALHHWHGGNFGGAISLLTGGVGYLSRVPPVCRRIDVAEFIAQADRFREALTLLGPTHMAEVDRGLIPRLRLVPSAED